MQTNNLADVWDEFLGYVHNNSKNPGYINWIKSALPLSMNEDTFEIGVEKLFIKEWIESRYSSEIEKTLSTLTGRNLNLIVTNMDAPKDDVLTNYKPEIIEEPPAPAKTTKKNFVTETVKSSSENIESNLISKYLFENFVIGNSNRFAHAAALAVAEAPAKVYNPLFLYGDVGLGKTHLMHAIGNRVKQKYPEMKVLYISSETFTNEMIFSIQKNAMEAFRNKYRNIDCLLIDDIQFLRKKESTQEEFFHTFNALHDANKQIIISSDRKPKEIETLESRLRSRFEWGLTADVQAPDLETRMAILREKADREDIIIPNDVILFIASAIETNIREIEGAFTRVSAYASFNGGTINLEQAKKALSELNNENNNKHISIEEIQKVVANYYKIKKEDFLAKKRTRNVAYPRQIAMYISRELTDYSLPRIGEFFGGRDHTTVIHACEKISKERKEDAELEKVIKIFISQLKK
ncbi:chromosomal replication initiator protein DnaA [Candidatus Falkowbacteria bacterium]|nr:chromosomal replication initiator protein DnaA [Candidatus Falkowbacteria bacterium]